MPSDSTSAYPKEGVRFMSRKCSICNHDRRQEIEHALLRGESHRAVAQQFTVPRGAVGWHLKHVSTALTQARKLREVEDGKSILIQLRDLKIQAEQSRARADRAGDYRGALVAVREKTRLVELEARLTGELNERPETKILNFTLDAETARRMTETFLARHLGVKPT
jgi:DNA-binding transcriptional ArsR family regulator